jgi:hypothetical protein
LSSPGPIPRTTVAGTLTSVLAPYLGDTMARASVESQLEKLGFAEQALTWEQLTTLVEKLGQGLNVFLGRARASSLVETMKTALAPAEGS